MVIRNDAANASLYTDLTALQKLKGEAKQDGPEALKKVAQQFEQMFLGMLLKSMRDANETFGKDNFLNSSDVRFYQNMLDNQMTSELSQQQGIGLADILVRQLDQQVGIRASDEKNKEKNDFGNLSEVESLLRKAYYTAGQQSVEKAIDALLLEGEAEKKETTAQSALPAQPLEGELLASPLPELPFSGPADFVARLSPIAEQVATELGVDPKVLLAQAALETGWGAHVIKNSEGQSSHNLFNIKADGRWAGSSAAATTLEYREGIPVKEQARFRAYGSYQESFRDYVSFLQQNPRYDNALNNSSDPEAYLNALQKAGYATDNQYASKILSILSRPLLNGGQDAG